MQKHFLSLFGWVSMISLTAAQSFTAIDETSAFANADTCLSGCLDMGYAAQGFENVDNALSSCSNLNDALNMTGECVLISGGSCNNNQASAIAAQTILVSFCSSVANAFGIYVPAATVYSSPSATGYISTASVQYTTSSSSSTTSSTTSSSITSTSATTAAVGRTFTITASGSTALSTSTSAAIASNTAIPAAHQGLSTGEAAGVGVGVAVAVLGVVAVAIWLIRHLRARNRASALPEIAYIQEKSEPKGLSPVNLRGGGTEVSNYDEVFEAESRSKPAEADDQNARYELDGRRWG